MAEIICNGRRNLMLRCVAVGRRKSKKHRGHETLQKGSLYVEWRLMRAKSAIVMLLGVANLAWVAYVYLA